MYDLSVLVGTAGGTIQAALTIAALASEVSVTRERLLGPLRACAKRIGQAAGLLVR